MSRRAGNLLNILLRDRIIVGQNGIFNHLAHGSKAQTVTALYAIFIGLAETLVIDFYILVKLPVEIATEILAIVAVKQIFREYNRILEHVFRQGA